MRRWLLRGCLLVLALAAPRAGGAPPASRPAGVELTHGALEMGIAKAQAWLWAKRGPDATWGGAGEPAAEATALAAHVLIEAGVSPQDPRMVKALK